jgi:hypothetical protein
LGALKVAKILFKKPVFGDIKGGKKATLIQLTLSTRMGQKVVQSLFPK